MGLQRQALRTPNDALLNSISLTNLDDGLGQFVRARAVSLARQCAELSA